jgi:transposase
LVLDNAPIHRSDLFKKKQLEWQATGVALFFLPSYSPQLNLIAHLWRLMNGATIGYEWIEFDAYDCWNNLLDYVEKIALNFGTEYTINFV